MIYTISGSKGGIGKTTCVYNLAFAMDIYNIIELDPNGSISVIIQRRRDDLFTVYVPKNSAELIKTLEIFYQSESKHVFVDCGGFDSDLNQKAIAAADLILTPCAENLKELNGLRIFNNVLESINKQTSGKIKSHIFPFRNHHAKKRFTELASVSDVFKNLEFINERIAYSELINKADERGLTVLEAFKYSSVSHQFKALAEKIKADYSL